MPHSSLRNLLAVVSVALVAPALAAPVELNLPAQPLSVSLRQLGEAAGLSIAADSSLTGHLQAPAVNGMLEPTVALQRLLAGSGLSYQHAGNTLIITRDDLGSSLQLDATSITGTGLGDTTEGTGSYATGSTSTATKLPLTLRETPQSVSVISRQRMDDQNLTQLTDAVRQAPGLSMTQSGNTGSDSSPIYSRGFQVENYQIDGEPMLGAGYMSIFQSNDLTLYDRIEVIRGATGLTNGVGTPGATINLVRKRPTSEWKSSVGLKTGSWDNNSIELDSGGPLNESGTVRARMVAAYRDAGSHIDRLNERHKVLYGIVEADLTPGTLLSVGADVQHHDANNHARLGLPLYYSDGSKTDWSRADSAATAWGYSERHYASGFASVDQQLTDDWKARITLSRGRYEYDEVLGHTSSTAYPDRLTGTGGTVWGGRWGAKPVQDSLDMHVRGSFELFGQQHDLVVGHSRQETRYKADNYDLWTYAGWSNVIPTYNGWDGKTPAKPDIPVNGRTDYNENQQATYGSLRLRTTDQLSVFLGARVSDWENVRKVDNYASADTNTRRTETGVITPFAGLVYDFDDTWSAYASYTTIFKPQNNRLLDGSYIDPLEGEGYEVGIKAGFFEDRLNFSTAIYQIEQDNLAVAIPDTYVTGTTDRAYTAESGTKTRGFEVELTGELQPNWQLSSSFSRNIVQDSNGRALNTNIPQNTAKLFTSYLIENLGNGLTLGGGVNWQNAIYTDGRGPNSVRFTQESYAVVDLMARYPITEQLSATLNVNNLLDKAYYTSTSSAFYGTPRNATLGLRLAF
ncbi:TonB-dependent siderophore receptor [Pseudomonas sp. PA15(2017)]|uniref:TonB-dependent siderophore receptor n=1 Tax=Pseudomonas sp. PA15(2017) TaxID=1932111 RepID=UPI0009649F60|nr:TonB-dependent receptor [Pseudomonas sp. PA15(2017)]OLU25636.1 TonB-dependent siderophore receptor [Pseudomonas sp. PA15(2017)]